MELHLKENTLVCRFFGRLTTENSTGFAEQLSQHLDELKKQGLADNHLQIVFDMEEVIYLSSSFLRVCFMAAKKAEKDCFSIINTNQFVQNLLITSGLENMARIEIRKQEEEAFPPPEEFVKAAHIKSFDEYKSMYDASVSDPDKFWAEQAKDNIAWFEPFSRTLDWNPPYAGWFTGGKLNASSNCLDKHLQTDNANKAALIWEGEPDSVNRPGEERVYTYRQLHFEVCRFANVLKKNGVRRGDRVIIYMPMTPEAVIAMLSCARIGAIHSVVFGGFSAQSIAERIQDCQAKIVITADGGYRRGTLVQLKKNVDQALKMTDDRGSKIAATVEKVIVHRRAFNEVHIEEGRDIWWHQQLEYVNGFCPAEPLESEDGLFILYTSGSTGKPKGIYHTTAGYLLGASLSFKYIFDIHPQDIFWCTADIGWITGHSYVVYGPLMNGATVMLYEGAPDFPEPDRFWK